MRAAESPARQLVRVVLLWQRKGAAALVLLLPRKWRDPGEGSGGLVLGEGKIRGTGGGSLVLGEGKIKREGGINRGFVG